MHIQIPALAKTLQLTKESLFVDVGGYIGDFTKHVLLNFDCKVLLFEPYIPYFEKCQKRFRNDTRVIVLPLGLGKAGSRIMYEHKEGTSLYQDWHNVQDENKIEDIKDKLNLYLVELTDAHAVEKVIKEVRPDEIYHLAAQSYVKLSWDAPLETYRINIDGTINILEAVRRLEIKPAILITSTSEIYGEIEGKINENTVPNPITHYGISKYAQDMIARLYHRSYGMNIVITRAFNITGSGRADVFVDSSFAKQVVEIENGKKPIIYHGNLESERDFVSVHDVVEGYIKALRSKKLGEVFCLGSGKPIKISRILNSLITFRSE